MSNKADQLLDDNWEEFLMWCATIPEDRGSISTSTGKNIDSKGYIVSDNWKTLCCPDNFWLWYRDYKFSNAFGAAKQEVMVSRMSNTMTKSKSPTRPMNCGQQGCVVCNGNGAYL